MKNRTNYIIIGLLVLFALFIRLLYIDAPLWYDEACSWTTAIQNFPSGVMKNLLTLDIQHTPLYFFILHFWMKIFGQDEIILRILSLIFGLATIPLTYIVTKKISSKPIAILCSLFAAVSPVMVIFSVEVRMYSMAIFLVLLSINYLIDFEKNADKKSVTNLTVTNILLPYTFVGAIFYNFSLALIYSLYLRKNDNHKFKTYIKAAKFEWICLIPYFILIIYYAKIRSNFVISHEGGISFFNIVDVIRNFFGTYPEVNIYWPSSSPYPITLLFTILVIIPCTYIVIGFVKGLLKSQSFIRVLYCIIISIFSLGVIFAALNANVFTTRYILYLLIPAFILSVVGLSKIISDKHFKIFMTGYLICCCIFSIINYKQVRQGKLNAFKAVALEAKKLDLGVDDVVIMPFGSDSEYYFKDIMMPKLLYSDFHKIVRNPDGEYYNKSQAKEMKTDKKYKLLSESISNKLVFSSYFFKYFVENVNYYVPSGRFVLLAMYDSDVNGFISSEDLQKLIKQKNYIKDYFLDAMFKKYMTDITTMLNVDFEIQSIYKKNNYTYILYKKR